MPILIGTEVAHVVTRTPLSRSKGQWSTCRGRAHIVAASRTACLDCYHERSKCSQLTLTQAVRVTAQLNCTCMKAWSGVAHSVNSRKFSVYCIGNISLPKQTKCLSPPTYFHQASLFLPRDAMRKQICPETYAQCLSVRLSETLVHTAEDIVKSFCRHGSPIILVLDPSVGTQIQGDPFSGGAKCTGWQNFAIFD